MKKQSTILPDIETAKRVYLGDMFYYYINQIINIICKYNENAKQKHDLNHKLYEFTKYFINKGYAVKFYTTNYDSIVPQALSTYFRNINIYDGLLPPDINNIKQFNHDLHLFKIARLSYFNLHGSIFWRNIFNNNSIPHYEVSYYDKVDNLKYAQANKGGNPNQPLIFTPIITGYNKTQRMSSFPFNIGFNAFVNDCHDCTTILVVGYSFSDPHINCILSTFVDWRKTKFALITTSISEQDKYEIENITNTYLPCIKTIDWLHYNGSYNHIYILGYEYFLADKSNWKYLL
jgi:hypothetical protein